MAKNNYASRAKIFLPFDALKGFNEALREVEKIKVPKREIDDEEKEKISNILSTIKKNYLVKIIYFENFEYIELTGIVSSIDFVYKKITIVEKKIDFDDILEISILRF